MCSSHAPLESCMRNRLANLPVAHSEFIGDRLIYWMRGEGGCSLKQIPDYTVKYSMRSFVMQFFKYK